MSVLVLAVTLVAAGAAGFLLPRLVAERLELHVRTHGRKLELEDVLRDPVLCFSVFMAAGLVFDLGVGRAGRPRRRHHPVPASTAHARQEVP